MADGKTHQNKQVFPLLLFSCCVMHHLCLERKKMTGGTWEAATNGKNHQDQ